jgi:ATP synthase protein I
MNKMPDAHRYDTADDEAKEPTFKQWTADEARALREKSPSVSPWRVIGWQSIAGALLAMGLWFYSGDKNMVTSALYGALSVIIPAAIFLRGVLRQKSIVNAYFGLGSFFIWELVKIGVTVALLLAAPRLIPNLNWLTLVVSFVVTMKVYWVFLLVGMVRNKSSIRFN